MATLKLTEDMCQTAFRAACEAAAKAPKPSRYVWTAQMDADLLYAYDTLGLSLNAIGQQMRKTIGWGSRSAVDNRLRQLKGGQL
jgi:hypothetical protein